MEGVFTTIDEQCPFCRRKFSVVCSHFVPRQVADCRCGATVEIRPLKQTNAWKAWACDWEAA